MFDVLESSLNEYGEIIMQHFASSNNNNQLKIVLHVLNSCGLSSSFALSDVPDQYCHLLERIFPLLTNCLEDHEPSDENSGSFSIPPLTGSITRPNSIESIIFRNRHS